MDAFDLASLGDPVRPRLARRDPAPGREALGLLRVLRKVTIEGGTVLIETYGLGPQEKNGSRDPSLRARRGVRARRVHLLGVRRGRPRVAGEDRGFKEVQSLQTVTVDGHPWIIGRLLG